MDLLWKRDQGVLTVGNYAFDVTSVVRNEVNGWRRLHDPKEVVYGTTKDRTKGPPIMPRQFPKGTWGVTGIEFVPDIKSDFFPLKILTNANRILTVWDLDSIGGYDKATDKQFVDWAYWLHWVSWSSTTQGCGKVGDKSPSDILHLASIIYDDVYRGNCKLEVI